MPTPAAPAPASLPVPSPEAVADALARPRWHLRFVPALEARFEADRGAARRRELMQAGLLALLVYDLFLLNDRLVRPEVLAQAAAWRLGGLTTFGVLMLALLHRGLAPRWREAAMASTLVVAMAASGMIFLATRSAAAVYDPFAFSLVFLAGNIAFGLRFLHALGSSAACLAVAFVFLHLHPLLPAEARQFAMALMLGTAMFTVLACYRIERSVRESYLLVLRESLRSQAALRTADEFALLSNTDALTGLPNRRAFDAVFAQRWLTAAAQRDAVALLLVDIDHFKHFNDSFGHPAGDACLQRVAATLQARLRENDFVARVGGEEFGVLLRPGPPAALEAMAERLREGVQALGIPHAGLSVVTISLGLAQMDPAAGRGADALMAAADAALYQAKRNGRNRWVRAGSLAQGAHDAQQVVVGTEGA